MTSICHGNSSFQFSGFRFQKNIYMYISSRFFENQPNEICSHLSEKASKGRLLGPDKLQNYSIKRREKEKERGGRKEQKKQKKQWLHSQFFNGYFEDSFWPEKKKNNCCTQKVHLVVTFSNIRRDTSSETQGREKRRDASFQVWAKEPLG